MYLTGCLQCNIGEPVSVNRLIVDVEFHNNVKEKDFLGMVEREFLIYPQYCTLIDGINYRIDIALVLNRKIGEKIISTKKIALECDGYDYHSSPKQKKDDDIRTRKLKKSGWKDVLRYSGSELYGLKESSIPALFDEIIDILYT